MAVTKRGIVTEVGHSPGLTSIEWTSEVRAARTFSQHALQFYPLIILKYLTANKEVHFLRVMQSRGQRMHVSLGPAGFNCRSKLNVAGGMWLVELRLACNTSLTDIVLIAIQYEYIECS